MMQAGRAEACHAMQDVCVFAASRAAPELISRPGGQNLIALGGVGGLARIRSSMLNGLSSKSLDGEHPTYPMMHPGHSGHSGHILDTACAGPQLRLELGRKLSSKCHAATDRAAPEH